MSLVTTSISAAPSLERSASGRAWPGLGLGWFGLGLEFGSRVGLGFGFGSRYLNYSVPSCARRNHTATTTPQLIPNYVLPTLPLPTTHYSTYFFTILRSKMASSCRRPAMITAATYSTNTQAPMAIEFKVYLWFGLGLVREVPIVRARFYFGDLLVALTMTLLLS